MRVRANLPDLWGNQYGAISEMHCNSTFAHIKTSIFAHQEMTRALNCGRGSRVRIKQFKHMLNGSGTSYDIGASAEMVRKDNVKEVSGTLFG